MRTWRYVLVILAVSLALLPPTLLAAATGSADGSNTIVRVEVQQGTNLLGRMDVELFDHDKPETVRNFLLYLQSGAYSNMFLHRCVPGFIVQGGGFAVTNPTGTAQFSRYLEVTNYGSLTNEYLVGPRLGNTFGTVAMAKIGGDPDSATSQWFFNLGNNTNNLDNQNGGFTVFGRVLESTNSNEGTNVLTHFNRLSTSAGIVNLGSLIGSTYSVFSDLPVSYTNTAFRVPANNELYYLKLSVLNRTNQPGPLPPTVTIIAPSPNSRFTNQTVRIRGTAGDDTGVARVVYRVQGGAPRVASGTTNWEVNLAPQPGFNTVTAESIDCDGNRSTNSASVTFFYVSQLRLDLHVTGSGRVDGATNGQFLQAGRFYRLTAKATGGQVFDGWSGFVTSASPTLSFQVPAAATNLSLEARFKPEPLKVLTGSYQGLVQGLITPALGDTAFLTMALTRNGIFSGSIRHQGGRYSYTGRFDKSGSATVQGTLGGVNRSLSLQLQLTNAAGVISGSLSGGAGSALVQLDHMSPGLPPTNPPPSGRYTLALLPSTATNVASQLVPGGHGFGTAKLTRTGILVISGTLGDGMAFRSLAKISRSRRWPLYTPLSGNRGMLAGWLIVATNDVRNLDGSVQWIQTQNLKAARYPLGFTNQVTCSASSYAPSGNGVRVLNWVHGLARISGANLELGVTNLVKLTTANSLAVTDPGPAAPTFTFDLASGSLTGRFVHPWAGTTNTLRGVVLKRDDTIRGQFLEADQSGTLLVGTAPFLVTQSVVNVTLAGLTAALSEGGILRFEQGGAVTVNSPLALPFDTFLDANGHEVIIDGGGSTRIFEVRSNQNFTAVGITFANGLHGGTNGANSSPPQPGGDGCGAGILNRGGVVTLTNCVLTNFVAIGGRAGVSTTASSVGAAAGRGLGAAICNLGGRVTLQSCVVAGNRVMGGEGRAATAMNLLSATGGSGWGGALFSDGGECEVRDTTLSANQATGGAPGLLTAGTSGRSGDGIGGAVAITRGSLRVFASSYLTNSASSPGVQPNNFAGGIARGGALFAETNTAVTVDTTRFVGNLALGPAAGQATNPGDASGGGIFSAGNLQLRNCTLEQNVAQGGASAPPGPGYGGALASHGTLVLDSCTLNDNRAQGGDGVPGGTTTAGGAEGSGGAVFAGGGSLMATNSTLALNRAVGGSAAAADGLRGDGRGGAFTFISNSAVLVHLTVASNLTEHGNFGDTNTGTALGSGIASVNASVSLKNSIVAGNAPVGFFGSVTDLGYNLSSDTSLVFTATGSRTNIDPLLAPLTTNDGPTLTMALLVGSPARDVVPTNGITRFDQRGVERPQGATGDIGAFEARVFPPPPNFVLQPSSGTRRPGEDFTFSATASGTEPIRYFWLKDGTTIPGATNTTLFLANVQPTNAGNYAAVATNIFGAVTSLVATLTVDSRPLILSQPADFLVTPGATATFAVTAVGPELNYQWFHDFLPAAGGTNATLAIINAAPGAQGNYQVIISNFAGTVTSRVASLTFNSLALSILTPPQNTTVLEGRVASLTVQVSGIPPFGYQWFRENAPLPDATNSTFAIASANVTNTGVYRVVVTNAYASLTSPAAFLNVLSNLPGALVRGPYLQSGSPTGAVVRWRSERFSDGVVRHGTNLSSLDATAMESAATNDHIVQLTGLEPDTRYFYSIGSTIQQLAGGTNDGGAGFWFRTSPQPGTRQPTRLWVLGDSGTAGVGSANRQIITRTAYETYAATNGPADLWLMLGDNAYNSGTDTEHQRAVFDIYPATLRNLFLWPTIGNHETSQSFTAVDFPYLHIFSLPKNAEAGGLASGTEKYYSFDRANIHFICLDSMTSGRTTNTAMARWLVNDLAATAQEWIIVFFHHPPYTKGSHDSDAETELSDIRENILPILEANGVDLVLSGHSHSYERSFLLNGHYDLSATLTAGMKVDGGNGRVDGDGAYTKTANGVGTSYIVAGHAGQASGGPLNHPAHFLSLNELGSLIIDVASNRLDVAMLSTNAEIHDHFSIVKHHPPLAGDSLVNTLEDMPAPLNLSASDPDGNAFTLTVVTAPLHGTARVVDGGGLTLFVATNGTSLGTVTNLVYVPDTNFHGQDSLKFRASNAHGESRLATVTIHIAPINDPPTADSQNLVVKQGAALSITLTGADVDMDSFTYVVGTPEHGSLSGVPPNLVYTPAPPYVGPDQFSFVTDDGRALSVPATIAISVNANAAPIVTLTSPTNNAFVPAPADVPLGATASDPDGSIALVEFFEGGNKIGEATNSPYALVWSNTPPGTYTFLAVATDDGGLGSTSAPVVLNVESLLPLPLALGLAPTLSIVVESTNLILTCRGPAGSVQRLQSAVGFGSGAPWTEVATVTLPESGEFIWSFPRPRTGACFYRVVSP